MHILPRLDGTKPVIRIMSNFAAFANSPYVDFSLYTETGGRLGPVVRQFIRSFRCDYLVLNCNARDLTILLALQFLCPFNRCRFVAMDLILPSPRSARDRITIWVKRLLFRRLHSVILYFRDTSAYTELYGIRLEQIVYVPFKINSPEVVREARVCDSGYIFTGGLTRRDYDLLFEAVKGLDCRVKMVCPSDYKLRRNHTRLDYASIPENVELIRDDGSVRSFIDFMAGARLVVIPLIRENISASGLSVYIKAMALGKCVIITDGPATRGVLPSGCALVVPPGDAATMREAIRAALDDETLRDRVGRAGKLWAEGLGGEERLRDDILRALVGADGFENVTAEVRVKSSRVEAKRRS